MTADEYNKEMENMSDRADRLTKHSEKLNVLAQMCIADGMPSKTTAALFLILVSIMEDIEALARRDNVTYH